LLLIDKTIDGYVKNSISVNFIIFVDLKLYYVMLKSICYKSTINIKLSVFETESLFDACKKNNDSLNIRGLLYKYKSNYFQIIEGYEENIDKLYSKLKKDKKHKSIKIFMSQPIKEFTFNDFTTGYFKVNDLDTIYGLQEYHSYLEKKDIPEKEDFMEILSNLFS